MTLPAWLYDLLMAPLDALGLRHYRRRLMAGLSGRVLELGAGTGRNGRHHAPATVAVDHDLAFLKRAKEQGIGSELVCADARALPFRDGTFDRAVESLVFCSLPEPEKCLAELARVVKSDGEIRMLDHVRAQGGWARVQHALAPAWLAVTGDCHLDRDVKGLVEKGGLRIERYQSRWAGWLQEVVARPPRGSSRAERVDLE
ncbi:MAG TPA: class I SAM-dependent methyltransferase [Myxococcales bacterium]|jgi:ubiquinone/menaquinone biosynthesis C-methylase UbiE